MGILNVTPDSFSGDGLAPAGRSRGRGRGRRPRAGTRRSWPPGRTSSTSAPSRRDRPPSTGSTRRSTSRRSCGWRSPWSRRWSPSSGTRALISIDTTKGDVARAALAAGAGMVNDVWAARRDPGTAEAAAAAGAYLVVMHNKDVAEYPDGVLPEVIGWLRHSGGGGGRGRRCRATGSWSTPASASGRRPSTASRCSIGWRELKAALGLPLLVGTSRKRFIGEILDGAPPDERLEGTAASVGAGGRRRSGRGAGPRRGARRTARPRGRGRDRAVGRGQSSDGPALPGRISVLGIRGRRPARRGRRRAVA